MSAKIACPTCGIPFVPSAHNPEYCTPACRPDVRAEYFAAQAAAAEARRAAAEAARPKRRTRSERFAVLNAFVDLSLADLTKAETKVWLILYRDTKKSGDARTSQTDLARRAGVTTRAVKLALKALQVKGLLQVVRRGRLHSGPSVYIAHGTGGQNRDR